MHIIQGVRGVTRSPECRIRDVYRVDTTIWSVRKSLGISKTIQMRRLVMLVVVRFSEQEVFPSKAESIDGGRRAIRVGGYLLPPFALRHDTINLVKPAVGAGRAMLDDIAPNLASSATLTGLGSSSLHGPTAHIGCSARTTGFALQCLRLMVGRRRLAFGGIHDNGFSEGR
jgi:hypothetical protein